MKTKRTSQYANEHGLPRPDSGNPDSARLEHGGGSRRNTKGEYVVLVWQKHYLTDVAARVFTVFEKLVAAYLYRMRISRVRAFLVYAHVRVICTPTNLRMRMATTWHAYIDGQPRVFWACVR